MSILAYLATEVEAGTVTPDEAVAYAVHFLSVYELASLLDKDSISVPIHATLVAEVGSRVEGEIDETEIATRLTSSPTSRTKIPALPKTRQPVG